LQKAIKKKIVIGIWPIVNRKGVLHMATEATIKTAIPTTSGFRNFAFYILIFAFSLLPSPFSLFTYPFFLLRSRHLYTCKESSTNHPLLCKTNPILSAVGGLLMNVKSIHTVAYENKWQRRVRKNKPNSNPNKPNFRKAQMNVNSLITKDYRKKDDFAVQKNKPNSNPILSAVGGLQMNLNFYLTKDYENESTFRRRENKPNTKPIKANFKLEANLSLRERRSLRVSFSESSNRGPISNAKKYVWVPQKC